MALGVFVVGTSSHSVHVCLRAYPIFWRFHDNDNTTVVTQQLPSCEFRAKKKTTTINTSMIRVDPTA